MKNRGIIRGRLFMGLLLLLAAIINWAVALLMSPHGQPSPSGMEQVRTTVALFQRNSAIGTLVERAVGLAALSAASPEQPDQGLGDRRGSRGAGAEQHLPADLARNLGTALVSSAQRLDS